MISHSSSENPQESGEASLNQLPALIKQQKTAEIKEVFEDLEEDS